MSVYTHDDLITRSVVSQLRNESTQASWATDPITWARDVLGVHLWSKQIQVCHSVRDRKKTVVTSCHGTGKALELGVPLAVPGGGFRAMGEIEVGDEVVGSDGAATRVLAVTGPHRREMYRVVFSAPGGGEEAVLCSGEHVWPVVGFRDQNGIVTAAQRRNVPAVYWGMWHHRAENISTHELFQRAQLGEPLLVPGAVPRRMEWSEPQVPLWLAELFWVQGDLDSEGRAALLWTVPARQPEQAVALLREEVEKIREGAAKVGLRSILHRQRQGPVVHWRLAFPGWPAAGILADANLRALAKTGYLGRRPEEFGAAGGDGGHRVLRVERAGEGDVQCIQVDAEDSLYLCGESKVPTHNSMIASVIACWWVSTKPIGEAIVVSTAPTYPQVNKILWEEIRKHHATAKQRGFPMPGYVTQGDEWKTEDGRILGFGRKPATGDRHGFHGIHRRFVLAIGDEACGLPEELWTGIEAITTTDRCRLLYIGNPDDRNTEFGKVFLKDELAQDWSRIHISAFDTPNFTGEEVPAILNEVLVSKSWVESRLRDWGEKDPRYISKVLGEFPQESASSLIGPALVAQAFEDVPAQTKNGVLRLGVDVARFGTDANVVVSMMGNTAKFEDSWTGTDTVSSAHRVLRLAEDLAAKLNAAWVEIRVDAVGLGAGVVDTLNARLTLLEKPWFTVYEMHGSAAPPADHGGSVHGYGNARAWWYDQLRTSIRNSSVKIVDHDGIRDDLAMIYYVIKSGKLYVISKEEMRAKFGRSPDFSDALVYAVSPVSDGLIDGTVFSQSAQDVADEEGEMMEQAWDTMISPF